MGPHWASLLHSRLPSRCVLRDRMVNKLFTLKLGLEQETVVDLTELHLH